MRPLPQNIVQSYRRSRAGFLVLLAAGAWTLGCGGGGAVAPPPPPPPSITVSIAPSSGSVVLGNQLTFTATVTNTTDTTVSWSVNGIAGGNSTVGTISSSGTYTASAAHVVAVDNATGAVIGATLGGWSCVAAGPAQFDGTYQIAGLPVGSNYTVYAEALNGAANPSQFNNALTSLCRNAMTDAGWPPLQACVVPAVNISLYHTNPPRAVKKPL